MSDHRVYGAVLTSTRIRNPDEYLPFFNAKISKERRREVHTAYVIQENGLCIGMVWSAHLPWIAGKDWHWVSSDLSLSRRGLPTLYMSVAALHRAIGAKTQRAKRTARAAEDMELLVRDISFEISVAD